MQHPLTKLSLLLSFISCLYSHLLVLTNGPVDNWTGPGPASLSLQALSLQKLFLPGSLAQGDAHAGPGGLQSHSLLNQGNLKKPKELRGRNAQGNEEGLVQNLSCARVLRH